MHGQAELLACSLLLILHVPSTLSEPALVAIGIVSTHPWPVFVDAAVAVELNVPAGIPMNALGSLHGPVGHVPKLHAQLQVPLSILRSNVKSLLRPALALHPQEWVGGELTEVDEHLMQPVNVF
jgi:hypothetical protein